MNMKALDDAGLRPFPNGQRAPAGTMKGRLLLAAALLGVGMSSASVALAQSATTVYRCDGPDGTPLYQNAPGKGCRQLDLPPINSVPAAKLPVGSGSAGKSARVSDTQQRGRDSDRRRILEKELAKEQSRLDALRQEYNDGSPERLGDERNYQKYLDRVDRLKDEVAQAVQNVSSIRREIDSLP